MNREPVSDSPRKLVNRAASPPARKEGGTLLLRSTEASPHLCSDANMKAKAGPCCPCSDTLSESMAASDVVLYTYWRSSCSWRVRIALQWKGVPYESRFVNLVANGGQQHSADYMDVNPQKLVRNTSRRR